MIPQTIRQFNAFIDGVGYAGRVTDSTTPKLTLKTEDYNAAGMGGTDVIPLDLDKMEVELTFLEHTPALLGVIGRANIPMTLRAAAKRDDETAVPLVWTMRGIFTELDSGQLKAAAKVELKLKGVLRYNKLTHSGQLIHEIDIENGVRNIGGTDQMADIRAAIGM